MSETVQTIEVKNVARPRGTVDIEGGRVLAPDESCQAPDTPRTRAQIDAGLLVACKPLPQPPKLEDLTVPQLRDRAVELELDPPAGAVKADLIALIETKEKEAANAGA